jgi:hypothetical protein
MVERMVNFYHIQDKDHEGEWAAKVFVNMAAERGGLDKMSIIYLVIVNQSDSQCLYYAWTMHLSVMYLQDQLVSCCCKSTTCNSTYRTHESAAWCMS